MKKKIFFYLILIASIILLVFIFKVFKLPGFVIKYETPGTQEQSRNAFNYLNDLRANYNKTRIIWDVNAYNLAVERARDMFLRKYSDHINPEGKCVNDFKLDYGFNSTEFITENIGFMRHYFNGEPVLIANVKQVVNSWLESRGHKYNLLYSEHKKGAIGCYKYICVFLGIHNNKYGLGTKCVSVSESNKFWKNASRQEGEV